MGMNEKLREDVAFLKGKSIIKRDKEIADRTGFNKTVVSTYLSAKVNASKNFLQKFYEVFEKDLAANKVGNHLQTDKERMIDLEKENARLREIIESKDKVIDAQQKALIMAERFVNSITKKVAQATHPLKRNN